MKKMRFFVVVVLTSASRSLSKNFSILCLLFMLDIQSNAWEHFQSFGHFKFLVNLVIKFHLY